MKLRLFVFLVAACMTANSFSDQRELIEYSAIISAGVHDGKLYTDQGKISFDVKKSLVIEGHVELPIMNCSEGTEWDCKSYSRFIFAKKRSWKELPKKWEFEGILYENRGLSQLNLLGKSYDVRVITINNKANTNEYEVLLYSDSVGLVAFLLNSIDDESSIANQEMFVLSSLKGIIL
jgi:hypothetical protein